MKRGNNVITYYWDENKRPDRMRDKLIFVLAKRGVIRVHDGWTIERNMPDGSTRIVGAFYTVSGQKNLVDFLSWLTNFTLGETHAVKVDTDGDNCITNCKDL